jgi:hypothetical protein
VRVKKLNQKKKLAVLRDERMNIATILRILHFIGAGVLILATIFGPGSPYLVAFWLGMVTLFILNGGCILTQLERHLDGADVTIVDPFLHLMAVPRSALNRNRLTLGVGMVMLVVAILKMWSGLKWLH